MIFRDDFRQQIEHYRGRNPVMNRLPVRIPVTLREAQRPVPAKTLLHSLIGLLLCCLPLFYKPLPLTCLRTASPYQLVLIIRNT